MFHLSVRLGKSLCLAIIYMHAALQNGADKYVNCAVARRQYPAELLHASSPREDGISSALSSLSLNSALADISNTVAAAPPSRAKRQAAPKARRGRTATQAAPPEQEEADCVTRSSVPEADAGADALWEEAQDEASCTLRAAPRRSRAAAARPSAPPNNMQESAKEVPASDSDGIEKTDSDGDLPAAAQPAASSARGLRLSRSRNTDGREPSSSAAAKTPATVRKARISGDENAAVSTPAQLTTVRRGSRFAAMQTPAVTAGRTQLPPRVPASRLPLTAAQPLRLRPKENLQQEALDEAGKRDKARVSFAVDQQPAPGLETPSLQQRTVSRKKRVGTGTASKAARKEASSATDSGYAAEVALDAGTGQEGGCKGAAPFVIHRAPDLADLEGEVGDLGARMRALALSGGGLTGPADESAGGRQGTERSPVLLILDGELQSLPWESLPSLQRHRYSPICFSHCHACCTAACNDADRSKKMWA